jgi:hypothetical protein
MEHVAIRREEYVSGTRDRPEVGIFTQSHQTRHPVPWGQVSIGDMVWMKWAGGPIVAAATVQGFRQAESCSPDLLRDMSVGSKLHDLKEYWESLPPVFSAVLIWLVDERWLDTPIVPSARSRGESWIVLKNAKLRESWLDGPVAAKSSGEVRQVARTRTRTIGYALRFQVLRRDGFTCQYCGRRPPEVKLHIDHILPWSRGGLNVIKNLITSCEPCNLGKGAGQL